MDNIFIIFFIASIALFISVIVLVIICFRLMRADRKSLTRNTMDKQVSLMTIASAMIVFVLVAESCVAYNKTHCQRIHHNGYWAHDGYHTYEKLIKK